MEGRNRGQDIARWILVLPACILTFIYLSPLLSTLYNFTLSMIPFGGPTAPIWWAELTVLGAGSAGTVLVGALIAPRFRPWAAVAVAVLIVLEILGISILAGLRGLMDWRYAVGGVVQAGAALAVAVAFINEQ